MANEEHLRILEQGVEVWNRWRDANPRIRPLLTGLYLDTPNLKRATLCHANLVGAKFVLAQDYTWAFEEANLRLTLGGVAFKRQRIQQIDLSRVNLVDANLSTTWFASPDLNGADFSEALVGETVFDDVDLSTVQGLDTVKHVTRSTIGMGTIFRSGAGLSENFLRGTGAPDELILYVRSLIGKQVAFHSCFISYSSNDKDFTQRLYADLQASGVRCWFAPEDLKIGDRIRPRIEESIRLHDRLLLVLSERSLSSTWVADEVEAALESERQHGGTVLFPITLDDAVWASKEVWVTKVRRERHIGDFRCWKEHDNYLVAFERLLRDLKAEIS